MSCGASFLWDYFLTLLIKRTVNIADCDLFFICYLIFCILLQRVVLWIFSIMTCCYPAIPFEWLLSNIHLIHLNQSAESTAENNLCIYSESSTLTLLFFC